MKSCSYYGCVESAEYNENGFVYCLNHLAHMYQMMELDQCEDEGFNTVAFCLASLNNKAYNRQEFIQ